MNNMAAEQNMREEEFNRKFPVVEVEEISLEDSFMKYNPTTKIEKRVKQSIIQAKENGMKNFRKPFCNPSFSDDGSIIYETGRRIVCDKKAEWWEEEFKKFMPSKNSRMITLQEYDVYLGTIIKYLVETEKYTVADAWCAICKDDGKLGSEYSHVAVPWVIVRTGSSPIGKWFDVSTTQKIVWDAQNSEYARTGGRYCDWDESKEFAVAAVNETFSSWKLGCMALDY